MNEKDTKKDALSKDDQMKIITIQKVVSLKGIHAAAAQKIERGNDLNSNEEKAAKELLKLLIK